MKHNQILISIRQFKFLGEVNKVRECYQMIVVAFAHVIENQLSQLVIFFATVPVCNSICPRFLICVERMCRFDMLIFAKSSEKRFINLKVYFLYVIHFNQHQLSILFHQMIIVLACHKWFLLFNSYILFEFKLKDFFSGNLW